MSASPADMTPNPQGDALGSWPSRWRALDQQLGTAWQRAVEALHGDWAHVSGAAGSGRPQHAAYAEYGRLLGKLGRSPDQAVATLQTILGGLLRRDNTIARARLASLDTRLLALLLTCVAPAEQCLGHWARSRLAHAARPEAGAGHLFVKLLAALLLLIPAVVLLLAEFALAEHVTAYALGIDYEPGRSQPWGSPVRLFACALCALTLPFKFFADSVYDLGSQRLRECWTWMLVLLSAILVAAVGYMRGEQSHELARAVSVPAVQAGGSMPSATTTSPVGPVTGRPGDADKQARFVIVYVLAGLLFPLVSAATLSKARAPLAASVHGLTAWVAAGGEAWARGRLRRHEATLADLSAERMAVARQLGASSAARMFLGALRQCRPGVAEGPGEPRQEVGQAVDASRPSLSDAERQALSSLVDALPLDGCPITRHSLGAALWLDDAADTGLKEAHDCLSQALTSAVTTGYIEGQATAAELFADASATDLCRLVLLTRFGARHFAPQASTAGATMDQDTR